MRSGQEKISGLLSVDILTEGAGCSDVAVILDGGCNYISSRGIQNIPMVRRGRLLIDVIRLQDTKYIEVRGEFFPSAVPPLTSIVITASRDEAGGYCRQKLGISCGNIL